MLIKLAKPSEIPQSWYGSEIGFDFEIEDKISMHLIVILDWNLSFLLQRIIRHLPLSCVIIFLYLKRRREGRCLQRLMVRRPSK